MTASVPPSALAATDEVVSSFLTVRDLLRYATGAFTRAGLAYGHGTASALDEAVFLILETLRLPIDDINPWLDARLLEPERRRLAEVIAARVTSRKPAPYVVGAAYIKGRRFLVDERVIVPRSYIGELLAENGLVDALDEDEPVARVLDLCTGSGCLAILAAEAFPGALVDAVDVSKDALAVARANVDMHGMDGRIRLIESDLFSGLDGERYDLIVANPPYVAAPEVDAFPPEHAAEPQLAHLGGADGLDLVRRILAEARDHLEPGGTLVMEVGTGRPLIEDEFPDAPFFWLDTAESQGEVLAIGADDLADLDIEIAKPAARKRAKGAT